MGILELENKFVVMVGGNMQNYCSTLVQTVFLNPIQRGVFFANRKRGGGAYLPPQCIFGNFFGGPP